MAVMRVPRRRIYDYKTQSFKIQAAKVVMLPHHVILNV